MKRLCINALCILVSMLFVLSFPAFRRSPHTSDRQNQSAVPAIPEGGAFSSDLQTLFPSLDGRRISALHVGTPDMAFDFRNDPLHSVSVNGNRADTEIYQTLLSQIRTLPVSAHPAFPANGTPVMTLVVSTDDGAQHTARFYSAENNSGLTRIASSCAGAVSYHQTEAWRIGTLMMTCEGTRIQDARGNETPAVIP